MKQIIVFILLSTMLCWLMFSPIYKHVLIMRQAVLQKEVDHLLEIGTNASYGYINEAMLNASRDRLLERGFNSTEIIYIISTTNGVSGTDANERVIRGEGIHLRISYPYHNLLHIDQLIGISISTSKERMAAGGIKMSEYLP